MALKFNPFTGTLDYVESGATKEKAEGVPAGGAKATVLKKKTLTNYDDEWNFIQTENIENKAVTEAKVELPEMVTKTGEQTITGAKVFEEQPISAKAGLAFGTLASKVKIKNETVKNFKPEGEAAFYFLEAEGAESKLTGWEPFKGLGSAKPGQFLIFYLEGTNNLTLTERDTESTAANRFRFNGSAAKESVVLKPFEAIIFQYQSNWKQVSFGIVRAGEGLERESIPGNTLKVKALGITEAMLAEAVQRKLLGTVNPEAKKEETGAEKEIIPSATKAAMVVVSFKAKAATEVNYTIEVGGVAVQSFFKGATDLAEEGPIGTFYVPAAAKLKFKKTAGELEKIFISITLMN